MVTAICFSPDGKYIISTSSAGSIFVWKVPDELLALENAAGIEETPATEDTPAEVVEPIRTAAVEAEEPKANEENIVNLDTTRSSEKSERKPAPIKCRCIKACRCCKNPMNRKKVVKGC